jgi:double-strand break repair protein MRE11
MMIALGLRVGDHALQSSSASLKCHFFYLVSPTTSLMAVQSKSSVLRIVVATDTHLGFKERDEIRKDDAFMAFEEVLQTARQLKADMIIHGGDLFHEHRPSRQSLHRCMKLLRDNCLGDGNVGIKVVSNPLDNFDDAELGLNYENPNINVSMPVFAVHGNHDDPGREGYLAANNILSVAGLVNFFGKVTNLDSFQMKPVLIEKDNVKIALYGLGYLPDARLLRMLQQKKVKWMRPEQPADGPDPWFNIFVIHQTRNAAAEHIPDHLLPSFLHFVIWGHEHECLIDPVENVHGSYISQLGSSVQTSLTEGEAKTKHFLVLDVRPGRDGKSEFRAIKRAFKNVRPFIYRDISLSEMIGDGPRNESAVKDGLSKYLERLISEPQPETQRPHHSEMSIPLVRLRIEHTGFHTINPQQFGHNFVGRVANYQDLLCFYKKRAVRQHAAPSSAAAEEEDLVAINLAMRGESVKIHDIVAQILKETQTSMRILGQDVLQQALVEFAEKEDKTAIEAAVNAALGKVRKHVIAECNQGRQLAFIDDANKVDKAVERMAGNGLRPPPLDDGVAARPLLAQHIDDDDAPIVLVPENGRGVPASQRGGRGAARGGGRGGSAAAAGDKQSRPAKKAARTTLLDQTQLSAVNAGDDDSAGSDTGRVSSATQHAGVHSAQALTFPLTMYSVTGSKRPLSSSSQRNLPFGPSQSSVSAAAPSVRGFGASQAPTSTQAALEIQTGFSSSRLFGSSQGGKAASASQAAAPPPRKLPFVKS